MNISDYLTITAIIVSALGFLLNYRFSQAEQYVTNSLQRQKFAEELSSKAGFRYRRNLSRGLNKLDEFIGKPFSFRSFVFSLSIAFLYPIIINTEL